MATRVHVKKKQEKGKEHARTELRRAMERGVLDKRVVTHADGGRVNPLEVISGIINRC